MNEAAFIRWQASRAAIIQRALERRLAALGRGQPQEIQELISAMGHITLGGGKRLRPLLVLAAAESAGGTEREAMPGALAVEMIHSYSLIHDDLPALDNDRLRRGKPTCHVVYGEATAILAGDALQSLAFQTLAKAASGHERAKRSNLAISLLSEAIGPLGMAGGQAQDLAFEKKEAQARETEDMEMRKTGQLLAASLSIGAALAGAGPGHIRRFKRIGLLAGQAFQIKDDLLNLEGDPRILGKEVGTDARRGKASAVFQLGAEKASIQAQGLYRKAARLAAPFESPKLDLLLKSMIHRAR
jgi:geranylgeranyl pyrophosphate synthase